MCNQKFLHTTDFLILVFLIISETCSVFISGGAVGTGGAGTPAAAATGNGPACSAGKFDKGRAEYTDRVSNSAGNYRIG
jgi:hypothetical protein